MSLVCLYSMVCMSTLKRFLDNYDADWKSFVKISEFCNAVNWSKFLKPFGTGYLYFFKKSSLHQILSSLKVDCPSSWLQKKIYLFHKNILISKDEIQSFSKTLSKTNKIHICNHMLLRPYQTVLKKIIKQVLS